jgi:predicted GNAT family acetyltransferase
VEKDVVNINHTFVDNSLRGQGIAGQLMKQTAEYLRQNNKKAVLSARTQSNGSENIRNSAIF